MTLKNKALSGIRWSTLSGLFVAVCQITQISVLTKFLQPGDFGLMAIMMVVIGLAQLFVDMGMGNAIIHHQKISHIQLSSLYWLNIGVGVLFTAILFILSPVIARFYNAPPLQNALSVLSVIFIIVAVGNQYRVLCQKELQLNRMAKIEISASFISLLVAILLAFWGLGVYALVFATLTQATVSSLLFLLVGLKCHHRPAFIYQQKELKKFFNFGFFQLGEKTINYLHTQFDILLIGKVLGAEATGIYHIAKTLIVRTVTVINPIVTKVTIPLMAKLQNDDESLKLIFIKTVNYVSLVSFPIFMAIAVLAKPLIFILFGEKWVQSVVILQVLAFYGMLRSAGNPVGSLILAKGRADLGFYWLFGVFLVSPLTLYVGSQWGILGVAFSQLILTLSLIIPGWLVLIKPLCGVSLWGYVRAFFIPFLMALSIAIILLPINLVENYLVRILATVLIGASLYIYILSKFNKAFVSMIVQLTPSFMKKK